MSEDWADEYAKNWLDIRGWSTVDTHNDLASLLRYARKGGYEKGWADAIGRVQREIAEVKKTDRGWSPFK